jgi:hypothetical protein
MEYFVWLDEAGVDDQTNHRNAGWAHMGQPCVRCETFVRGQRYSVLPALCLEGIIALDIFEGSVTKDRYIKFISEEVVSKSPLCHVAVIDQCYRHQS